MKISKELYKRWGILLDVRFFKREKDSKERARLMKLSSNPKLTKEERRMLSNDLYIINENITFESGAIDILRKFLHEIKLENIKGGENE